MAKFKKLFSACAALLATCAFAVGCGGGTGNNGNSTPDESTPPTSTGGGIDIGECAVKGHDFTYNNGICKCGTEVEFPAAPSEIEYLQPTLGNGTAYNRYECQEGYYSFEIPRGDVWLSFAVSQQSGPGQYALYSIETEGSVSVTRYDASVQNIPETGEEARVTEDGTLCSIINIGEKYLSKTEDYENYRATYCLSGKSGSVIRLRFVRICDPVWEPGIITENVEPKEINGKKAPEGDEGKTLVAVPYSMAYYYDEASGYYRLGSAEEPGEIIYVAITSPAERQLSGSSFAQIQYESNALTLGGKLAADGLNYEIYNYVPFIYNNNAEYWYEGEEMVIAEGDPTKNCYQNFVNSDGVYPVNQELHTFLKRYVEKHSVMESPEAEFADNAWLAACYYYKQLALGVKDNPHKLTELGTYTITTKAYEQVYYNLKWAPTVTEENMDKLTLSYIRIKSTDENAGIYIGTKYFGGTFDVIMEVNEAKGANFSFMADDFEADSFDVEISHVTPKEITENTTTLSTDEIWALDGTPTYQAYYVYNATEDGTLTLSSDTAASLMLGDNYLEDGTQSVNVLAGDEVIIYLSADASATANVTLSFSPADSPAEA